MPPEMAKFNHLRFFIGACLRLLPAISQEKKKMDTDFIPESIESNIKAKARMFVKKNKLAEVDIADIEQELRIVVVKGLQKYNPELASPDTFCDRIIRNKIKNLARKHYSEKNLMILYAEQLKENDQGNASSRHNALEESMNVDSAISFPLHVADLKSDINALLDKMPEELRSFCMEAAKGLSFNHIAREKKLSKFMLYKKYLTPIRKLCRKFCLHEYLDKSIVLRGPSCV
ncbi:MAG: hypothetical protein A2020_11910 [Lentisphaerae bacterium GWF2_45_14]|nr:MAG: hypothetical protein A2020_11910 [Lentisphaerae bacterium GWF2_45_14]